MTEAVPVVAWMSVQPTSAKRTVLQLSASPASAGPASTVAARAAAAKLFTIPVIFLSPGNGCYRGRARRGLVLMIRRQDGCGCNPAGDHFCSPCGPVRQPDGRRAEPTLPLPDPGGYPAAPLVDPDRRRFCPVMRSS